MACESDFGLLFLDRADRHGIADVDPGHRTRLALCRLDSSPIRGACGSSTGQTPGGDPARRSGVEDRMSVTAVNEFDECRAYWDLGRSPARAVADFRDNMIAPAWVLVAGDFHPAGGMDRANAELARYLCATRVPLHLVTHRVDADLADHPNVHVHLARR